MSFLVKSSSSSLRCTSTRSILSLTRPLSTTSTLRKGEWEGRKAKDHVVRENDSNNVQMDAVREGKKDRATSGDGNSSRGAGEQSGGTNEKAKKDFPEAPDTIGMQDERGGKDTA